jgi:hypothetical protein
MNYLLMRRIAVSDKDHKIAVQDWHARAIVRILETTTCGSVDPSGTRTFRKGEEVELIQWGNAGSPVKRDAWWTNFDIDGAFIIKDSKVEVIKVLAEVSPEDG